MRLIICDKCKKKLKNPKKIGYVGLNWRDPKTDEFAGRSITEDMDFCDECMDKIANFIANGDLVPAEEQEEEEVIPADDVIPDEDTEPEPEPEPEPERVVSVDAVIPEPEQKPEIAAVPAKSKTTVNVGRIRQLAEEGKSITRIAEITGYSYPTVKKYLGR